MYRYRDNRKHDIDSVGQLGQEVSGCLKWALLAIVSFGAILIGGAIAYWLIIYPSLQANIAIYN